MLLLTHEYRGPYLVHSSIANRTRKKGNLRLAALNGVLVGEFAMFSAAPPSLIAEEPKFIGSALSAYPAREEEPLFIGSAFSASGFGEHHGYRFMSSGRPSGLYDHDQFYFPPSDPVPAMFMDNPLHEGAVSPSVRGAGDIAPAPRRTLLSRLSAFFAGLRKPDSEPHPHRRRRPF